MPVTEPPRASGEFFPHAYHQMLCPPAPEPAFTDPHELSESWGARWGSHDEVGALKVVLMRRPGKELAQIRGDALDSSLGALVDPDGGWYWLGDQVPNLDRVASQHQGLAHALQAEGVEVVYADPIDERFPKAVFTRDPLISLPGGVLIARLAPRMRRGEEASITRAVAARGVPVLRTIVGTGMLEGGSLVKLNSHVAVLGTSIRCNVEGAEQLRDTLRWLGMELIVVPMTGFSIHLDGHLAMVDVDKAIVDAEGLPFWFIDHLHELGIEPIWLDRTERLAVNCLAVRPGRVLIADGCPRMTETLQRRGVETVTVPYDEIHRNGGGIHCSTMELLREPA